MNPWDEQAKSYEAARLAVWSEQGADWRERALVCLDAIVPAIESRLTKGSVVCEVGCGIGRLTALMAERYPEVMFIGLDSSVKMIQWAIDKNRRRDNLFWVLGNGHELEPGPVDAVYSMVTFQHVPEDIFRSYVVSVGHNLKRGGVFRFQFVDGLIHVDLDHRHPWPRVKWWLDDADMKIEEYQRGVIYPEWTWVTAVKR